MANYTKKALINVGIVFSISMAAAFFGYLVRIFFARNLSLEEFGLFYAVIAFIGLFSIFKSLGLDSALVFFIPKFLTESNFKKIKNSVIYVTIVLFITNLIFILFILLFANFIGFNFFKHNFASTVLILMAISFFIDSFVDLIKRIFQGFQRMALFSSIDLIRMILILIISFIFFKVGYGILSPVIAYIITPLILILLYALLTYNKQYEIFSKNKFFWEKPLFKKLRKYGVQLILLDSIGLVFAYSDRLLITYFRTLEEVGVYSAVFPTARLLWIIPISIINVLLPITSELWNKGFKKELKKGIELLHRFILIIVLPATLIIFVFSDIILELFYGDSFIIGGTSLKILVIGIMFYSFYAINGGIFSGMGKPHINTKILGLGAVVNIILNLFLIPKFGIIGAATASMISFILIMFLGFYVLQKENLVTLPYIIWTKTIVLSMFFLLLISYLNMHLAMNLVIKIPLILLLSGSAYVMALFILKLVTISEVKELLKRIRMT